MTPTARVNLAVPVDTMIQVERECDKRGISRTQFIKEAIFEKLKQPQEKDENEVTLHQLREEINELKKIILLTIEK